MCRECSESELRHALCFDASYHLDDSIRQRARQVYERVVNDGEHLHDIEEELDCLDNLIFNTKLF